MPPMQYPQTGWQTAVGSPMPPMQYQPVGWQLVKKPGYGRRRRKI